jgi:hypothetical protein
VADKTGLPRIRCGDDYAYRDAGGTLIETGWIGPEGEEHPDLFKDGPHKGTPRVDGTNPAAMVPVTQQWA